MRIPRLPAQIHWRIWIMPISFLWILGFSCFLVWQRNWSLAFAEAVVLAGVVCNMLAVALNGWHMPVKGREKFSKTHSPMFEDTRVKVLCDIHDSPIGVYSKGDVLLVAGNIVVLVIATVQFVLAFVR